MKTSLTAYALVAFVPFAATADTQIAPEVPVGEAPAIEGAGRAEPNGVVTEAPVPVRDYFYVSTAGGVDGVGALPGVGGQGNPTNGSTLSSAPFEANSGDSVVFYFDYVTSDGSGFADYAWARLVSDDDGSEASLLFTARTTPGGDTVPGFSMPTPNASLLPLSTPIISGAPVWDQLGGSSGTCYAVGCGHTGWVRSSAEISEDGRYRLEFGVTNWNDGAFQSGMAIAEATPDFTPVPGPRIDAPPRPQTGLLGDVATFDRNKPTVVITHGWQPTGSFDGTLENVPMLDAFYKGIKERTDGGVNVVAFTWEDAYFPSPLDIQEVAEGVHVDESLTLALELQGLMGAGYNEPIHLIGHSLGSTVNASATRFLEQFGLTPDQVTTLDAPIGYGVAEGTYRSAVDRGNVSFLDNYWGSKPTVPGIVIGSPIDGWEFDGGQEFPENHTGVWERYLESITLFKFEAEGGFNYSAALEDEGFYEEALKIARNDPEFGLPVYGEETAFLDPLSLIGGTYNSTDAVLDLVTNSNGYAAFDLEIPDGATELLFDLFVEEAGTNDWLEVVLGDYLLGAVDLSPLEGFGEIPLFFDLAGTGSGANELYFLLVDESGTGSSLTASNFRYGGAALATSIAPVPLPAGAWLLLGGLGFLGGMSRLSSSRRAAACPAKADCVSERHKGPLLTG